MRCLVMLACATIALGLSTSSASAQLVVASRTSVAGAAGAYYINLATDTATPLWGQVNNKRPNALAADDANHRLYEVDSARLGYWTYGTMGTAPTFISSNGGLYRSNGTTNTPTGVDGLAFANGTLYGWTNFASSVYSDGIYSIATSGPLAGLMTPKWLNNDVYDFDGLDFNPADGLFYGTNTMGTAGQVVGVYSIDALNNPNAVPQFVTSFDSSLGLGTGWDGLAIGNNALWLTQYVNGTAADNSDDNLYISKFDLTTRTYTDAFSLGVPSGGNLSTGATWAPTALIYVPEPATLGLAAIGLTLARRRRA